MYKFFFYPKVNAISYLIYSPPDYYTFFEMNMHVLPWEMECLKLLRSFPAIFMVIDSS